jgi:tripartite-type tricarboxylate transporter receptor subunit TctC
MFEPMVSSPEQFAEFIKADNAKWSKVLHEANIKVD